MNARDSRRAHRAVRRQAPPRLLLMTLIVAIMVMRCSRLQYTASNMNYGCKLFLIRLWL